MEAAVVKESHEIKDDDKSDNSSPNSSDEEYDTTCENKHIDTPGLKAQNPTVIDIKPIKSNEETKHSPENYESNEKALNNAENDDPESSNTTIKNYFFNNGNTGGLPLKVQKTTTKPLIDEIRELHTDTKTGKNHPDQFPDKDKKDAKTDKSNLEIKYGVISPQQLQEVASNTVNKILIEEVDDKNSQVVDLDHTVRDINQEISMNNELLDITQDTIQENVKHILSTTSKSLETVKCNRIPEKLFLEMSKKTPTVEELKESKELKEYERSSIKSAPKKLIEEISYISTENENEPNREFEKDVKDDTVLKKTQVNNVTSQAKNILTNYKEKSDSEQVLITKVNEFVSKRKLCDEIENECIPLKSVKFLKVESSHSILKSNSEDSARGLHCEEQEVFPKLSSDEKCQNNDPIDCESGSSASENTLLQDEEGVKNNCAVVKLSDWQKLISIHTDNVENKPCFTDSQINENQKEINISSEFLEIVLDTTTPLKLSNNVNSTKENYYLGSMKHAFSLPNIFDDLTETPIFSFSTPNILYDSSEFDETKFYDSKNYMKDEHVECTMATVVKDCENGSKFQGPKENQGRFENTDKNNINHAILLEKEFDNSTDTLTCSFSVPDNLYELSESNQTKEDDLKTSSKQNDKQDEHTKLQQNTQREIQGECVIDQEDVIDSGDSRPAREYNQSLVVIDDSERNDSGTNEPEGENGPEVVKYVICSLEL